MKIKFLCYNWVTEEGGFNVTSFMVVIPGYLTSQVEQYMQGRFAKLWLNMTLSGLTQTITVVTDGIFEKYNEFSTEETNTILNKSWYSYNAWTPIFLATGSHNMVIKAFGIASAPNQDMSINIGFYIELTAPKIPKIPTAARESPTRSKSIVEGVTFLSFASNLLSFPKLRP